MKEIDFIPEWYKSGRRRQVNYRVQYIILSSVFAVMMVWNFVTAHSIAQVKAKNIKMEPVQAQSETVSAKLELCKSEMALLHGKEELLDSIDSNVNVSSVLAEISYLVSDRIVLSRVDLSSERIPEKQSKNQSVRSSSAVRSSVSPVSNSDTSLGNIRFRVSIAGVAAGGSDVAAFLCRLEDSEYFSHVDLSYSKDAQIKKSGTSVKNTEQDVASVPAGNGSRTQDKIQVYEFEISCYLSNYRQDQ